MLSLEASQLKCIKAKRSYLSGKSIVVGVCNHHTKYHIRGDNVNGFDPKDRKADPERLLG